MLMYYALYISIGTLILGILVTNKDVTLQVLNNISFKWVFDKSKDDIDKKREGQIQIKDLKKVNTNDHFSRYIGIRLSVLGAMFLILTGIGWFFADFQLYKIDDIAFFDDPNIGRDLISIQCVCIGIFTCSMTLIGITFSNKTYEEKIFKKVIQERENSKSK